MELSSTVTILSLILLMIYVYKKLTRHHNFFRLRGIECKKPALFFGNMWDALRDGDNYETIVGEFYKEFRNEKLFGIFNFLQPIIIVKDVDLIAQITTQHADKFRNRDHLNVDGIMSKSLFFLREDQAHDVRNAVHSFFVESNWREQHHANITSCADDLIKYYYRELCGTEEAIIDAKDVFEKFYSNVIAMTVLGVGRNCNYDRKSKIHEIAYEIQENLTSISGSLKILAMNIFPWIKFKIFQTSIYDFLWDHVILEIRKRRRRKLIREDFLQIFISTKWNDEVITAQVMSFLTAGFSTSSALFQACCFVLARNEKIRKEVENSECMEKFIYEVLRKWTPVSIASLICDENVAVKTKSGEVFKFFKGDLIEFPLRLINNDHKNFNDPQLVNTKRKENLNLAFGLNPRACIGENFAILIMKKILNEIVKNFKIESCDQTPYELNFCDKNLCSKNVFVKLKSKNNFV